MTDPLKGDYRMDPATAWSRPTGRAGSASGRTWGVILAILLALAIVFGSIALFLLPLGG